MEFVLLEFSPRMKTVSGAVGGIRHGLSLKGCTTMLAGIIELTDLSKFRPAMEGSFGAVGGIGGGIFFDQRFAVLTLIPIN